MSSKSIEITASEWLARFDASEVTAEERAAFEVWCNADPRHLAAYTRLSAIWLQLDRVQALRGAPSTAIDPDFLLTQPAIHDAIAPPSTNSTATRIVTAHRLAPVAAVVLVAIAWFAMNPFGATVYATSKGGFERVVLQDRSVVELNTDSKVQVSLRAAQREVELIHGEASFDVAHDAMRPFIVFAGRTAVRAVGTKFNVRRLGQSVEVVVSEGKVLVGTREEFARQRDAESIPLPVVSAGQAALSGAMRVEVHEIAPAATARKLAWQERMLVFEGESLSDVVAEFNRYNSRRLIIADPQLATLRIGGYFRPTNLDTFVSILESKFGVQATAERDAVILTRTGAEPHEDNWHAP